MKNLKYILAVIGLTLPLLSLIDNALLVITSITNPIAVLLSYFTAQNDLLRILVSAVIGGLIYYLIGILISNIFAPKKTTDKKVDSYKVISVVFLVFVIIASLLAAFLLFVISRAY